MLLNQHFSLNEHVCPSVRSLSTMKIGNMLFNLSKVKVILNRFLRAKLGYMVKEADSNGEADG